MQVRPRVHGLPLCPRPPYLSGARCFFSQLRSSSAGLVSARGLAVCRSEAAQKQPGDTQLDPTPAGLLAMPRFSKLPGPLGSWPSLRSCLPLALWPGFSEPGLPEGSPSSLSC